MYSGMREIPCTIQRAGTSKGVYFLENDLPADPALRDKVILAAFGSPDKRQIDGLGGADPLTSKVAIVVGSSREDADIEYTFGQVAIHDAQVFYKSICGNITSGVGPFAINHSLIPVKEGLNTIRMYNRNTGRILIAEVPVVKGKAACFGDYQIPGVPGSGARINVDFSQTVGALAGKGLLPTGNTRDILDVPGFGPVEVSIVDMAACQIYVRASDLGLKGTEGPAEVDSQPELLRRLESIRACGAYAAGLAATPSSASTERKNTPHLVIVGEKADYCNYLNEQIIGQDDFDVLCRLMFMQVMHKTYAGTGSICTAVATRIPGTIPNLLCGDLKKDGEIRIGHPCGVITVQAEVACTADECCVVRAAIGRTARTIMEGMVYVPESLFESAEKRIPDRAK